MTYLLKKRGFDVTSLELEPVNSPFYKAVNLQPIVAKDPIKLPFPDNSFDAVMSCGVLEHVKNDKGSLKEILRVLKEEGYLIIFMLPNKYSYIEHISDLLHRSDHPIRYTIRDIRKMLTTAGFNVSSVQYNGFLPFNMKGFPSKIAQIYHQFDAVNEWLDKILVNIPLVNRLSTNIEVVARKKG
jgi:SAM-dependent methyltransferase